MWLANITYTGQDCGTNAHLYLLHIFSPFCQVSDPFDFQEENVGLASQTKAVQFNGLNSFMKQGLKPSMSSKCHTAADQLLTFIAFINDPIARSPF